MRVLSSVLPLAMQYDDRSVPLKEAEELKGTYEGICTRVAGVGQDSVTADGITVPPLT